MKQGLYLAFLYLSSVIGAGFASGQEINTFFLSHGKPGFYAMLFAGLLFGVFGVRIFTVMSREKPDSLTAFLSPRIGKKVAFLTELFTQFFMISTFVVMISAGSTLLFETFRIPPFWGALLTFLLCSLPPLWGGRGLLLMSTLLVPLIILSVSYIGGTALLSWQLPLHHAVTNHSSPFYSALLFVSYNTLTLIPVTVPFRNQMNQKSSLFAGIFAGFFLLLLMLLSGSAIASYPLAKEAELPFLLIANRLGNFSGALYFIIMFASLLTTAATGAFAMANRFFPPTGRGRASCILFLGLLSLPLSLLGFSHLISLFYPFFGLLGLFLFPVYCIK